LIHQPTPQQIWRAFPVEQQEQILSVLIGGVAQQLTKPPNAKEVTHERS